MRQDLIRRTQLLAHLAAVAIVLVAAALRLVGLDRWPPGLHFDEAVYGLQAMEIVRGARPVFFSSYTGREPLFMYVMAMLFTGVGASAWVIRLTSAFIGVVTVALTYALGRSLYGRRVGLAAAALLAVSYWHITVSRNGYPNVLIPPLEAASAYFLWRGWRHGRGRDWVAGGALAGLVLYTYLAARFWPVFLAVFLVYALIVDRRRFAARWPGIALAVLAALAVFAPLGWHFYRHPADFWERANQVLAARQLGGGALWQAYLDNARRTAMAFFWPGMGDPRWHYNLPGRAIFQPLVAMGFLAGLAVCLRRFRDVRYALPVLWLAVLALPGVLTLEMQPAGQRIFGMFPALVLVPAIGLVTVAGWLGRRAAASPRAPGWLGARGVAIGLVVAVLVLDTAHTVRDYFTDWARQPETAHIFNADYAELARQASADLAAGRTVVILSEHYKHPTVAFLAPELVDGAVWAESGAALPFPVARGTDTAADVVYYRLTAALPDDSPATHWLAAHAADLDEVAVAPYDANRLDGRRLAVTRYRVPRAQLPGAGPAAAVALAGEAAVATGGAVIEAGRGDRLTVPVTLTALARPAGARSLSLQLRDDVGQTWAQADQTGYLAEQWRPGDRVTLWFDLELPRDMPAGAYDAVLVLTDDQARPLGGAGVATRQVRAAGGRARRVGTDAALAHDFGNGLAALEHAALDAAVPPGGRLPVDLAWVRRAGPAADVPATWSLHLEGPNGRRVLGPFAIEAAPGPAEWDERQVIRGRYRPRLPADLADGTYRVWLATPRGAASLDLGSLRVAVGARRFEAPAPAYPVQATFDRDVQLLGADLDPGRVHPGRALTVTLHWRANATPDREATVFVHLLGPDGRIVAQHDSAPAGGDRPLPGWLPGEVVTDRHALAVPADAPAGDYRLAVGLYDPADGRRWVASMADAPVPDDRVMLPPTVVVDP